MTEEEDAAGLPLSLRSLAAQSYNKSKAADAPEGDSRGGPRGRSRSTCPPTTRSCSTAATGPFAKRRTTPT